MKIGVEGGRAGRPGLKCGICGEHGGDAPSVKFCHGLGLDYVSCSPYRVPVARLAAAQAALANPRHSKDAAPSTNGAAEKQPAQVAKV
jgi:pyruvate,orthophosphate dikinase